MAYTGTNMSDVGNHIYTKAREYFDTLIHGEGSFAVDIPANGQTLTFTSALLGVSVTKMISKDDVVNIEGEPPVGISWEVLWQWSFSASMKGQILINSDFEVQANRDVTAALVGDLIEHEANYSVFSGLKAADSIVAETGQAEANDYLTAFTQYASGASLPSGSNNILNYFVIAKKSSSVTMPFEIGFYWQDGSSLQACVIKSDGTFVSHNSWPPHGDYIYISMGRFEIAQALDGAVKYYTFDVSNETGEWTNFESHSEYHNISITGRKALVIFAIPD